MVSNCPKFVQRFVWTLTLAIASGAYILPAPAQADPIKIAVLKAQVDVVYDKLGIPHIYAQSAEDAYLVLGYLHARDRMMEMEFFRRRAAGTTAELLGPEGLESDILVRKLGLRSSSEEALKSGLLGQDVVRWFTTYAEGVNARIAELRTDEHKNEAPALFKFLGVKIADWAPADSVSWMKYMGWDQSGTDTDLWFGMMAEKLGPEAIEELWPLDRPYEMVTIPTWPPEVDPKGITSADRSGLDGLSGLSGPDELSELSGLGLGKGAYPKLISKLWDAGLRRTERSHGSNNWVISGQKSTTGKPILCNDPHLGFSIPMIWYTAHLVAPGLNVTGVTFPGAPFAIIGHNDKISWGITNMQSDQVDYFVETINPENAKQYKHKGQWKEIEERKETFAVRGEQPREIVLRSTVHGPLEEANGKTVALCWTGLGVTVESKAIAMLNRCQNLKDFLRAMPFMELPAMNVVYADVEGNIAISPHGRLPIRGKGKGRVPVDGASGDYDWQGFIPHDQLPISINPSQGYLASANGRPTPVGYPHYLGWMWDPSYRTRRIHEVLESKPKHSFEDMERLQFDSYDKCASVLVPVLVEAYDRAPYGGEAIKGAVDLLREWDFVCDPSHVAPMIFAVWFGSYREMVWEDEWTALDIKQPGGGWGFTGDNKREPQMEVLEYLTRESPHSIWFDDRATPERESRDDILKNSLTAAVEKLRKQAGNDMNAWMWGNFNKLHVRPMGPNEKLARGGMMAHGGIFTVNPGGDGSGGVGGGASWRQITDMGNLAGGLGVYPGGQSEDPKSPHYDDQIDLWVKGKYVPLHFGATKEEIPKDAVEGTAVFQP